MEMKESENLARLKSSTALCVLVPPSNQSFLSQPARLKKPLNFPLSIPECNVVLWEGLQQLQRLRGQCANFALPAGTG